MTVSYTHLDVYKRQVDDRIPYKRDFALSKRYLMLTMWMTKQDRRKRIKMRFTELLLQGMYHGEVDFAVPLNVKTQYLLN